MADPYQDEDAGPEADAVPARARGYSEGPVPEQRLRKRTVALQALRHMVPLQSSRSAGNGAGVASRPRLSHRLGFSQRRLGDSGELNVSNSMSGGDDGNSSVGTNNANDEARDGDLGFTPAYGAAARGGTSRSRSNSPTAKANATANATATASEGLAFLSVPEAQEPAGVAGHRPRRRSITVAELARPTSDLLGPGRPSQTGTPSPPSATSPTAEHANGNSPPPPLQHQSSTKGGFLRRGSLQRQESVAKLITSALSERLPFRATAQASPHAHRAPGSPGGGFTPARADLAYAANGPVPQVSSLTLDADTVLKYGHSLRLWARSPYFGVSSPRANAVNAAADTSGIKGGYVGTWSKPTSRIRSALGRDQLLVLGPVSSSQGEYSELTLQVVDPTGKRSEGQPVRYGDVVCLVDMRGYALNSKTGGLTGYVDIKARHLKGEMYISFRAGADFDSGGGYSPDASTQLPAPPLQAAYSSSSVGSGTVPASPQHATASSAAAAAVQQAQAFISSQQGLGEPVRYGDSNVLAVVEEGSNTRALRRVGSHGGTALTAFKKESSSVAGGYLCCDGKGHMLRFSIHRSKAFVKCVTINQLERGRGNRQPYVKQSLHHNVEWETPITFELPAIQVASAAQARQPAVTVAFTNRGCVDIPTTLLLRTQGVVILPVEGGSEPGCLRCAIESRPAATPAPTLESSRETTARVVQWPFTLIGVVVVAQQLVWVLCLPLPRVPAAVTLLLTLVVAGAMVVAWKVYVVGGEGHPSKEAPVEGGVLVTIVLQAWEDSQGSNSESQLLGADMALSSRSLSDGDGGGFAEGDFIADAVPGLPPMPRRFLLAEFGDPVKAAARWTATYEWRQLKAIDQALTEPHPKFDIIKHYYRQFFHLPDQQGHLVYYELPGQMNLSALRELGVEREDLLRHYCYCMEYNWKYLMPQETDKLTIVLDCEGVGLRDLGGESAAFLKSTVSMLSAHYPQRSFKIMILNPPSLFSTFYTAVKPLLNESTRAKIAVVPPRQMAAEMLQVISSENLPTQYGGTCTIPLGHSPAELALRAHVVSGLQRSGGAMQAVPAAADT